MNELESGVAALVRRAVMSAARGEAVAAASHLDQARAAVRSRARRERQVVELVTAIVDGETTRAAGLAAEHRAEFPCDARLLEELLGAGSATKGRW
jgi:hypothetical protein